MSHEENTMPFKARSVVPKRLVPIAPKCSLINIWPWLSMYLRRFLDLLNSRHILEHTKSFVVWHFSDEESTIYSRVRVTNQILPCHRVMFMHRMFPFLLFSFQGQMETCYSAPSTTVKFAFYCDSACEQTDISFWYRFVTSEANREYLDRSISL